MIVIFMVEVEKKITFITNNVVYYSGIKKKENHT